MMKTNEHTDSSLFMPSGCLTADALEHLATGKLSDDRRFAAEEHIRSCAFCHDSYEGILYWLKGDDSKEVPVLNTIDENRTINLSASPSSKTRDYTGRISKINERLKNRIEVHHRTTAVINTRKISNPYRWVALAASIILFAGIFYLVKFRPALKESSLAITQEEKKGATLSSPESALDTSRAINQVPHAFKSKKTDHSATGVQNNEISESADLERETLTTVDLDIVNKEITEPAPPSVGEAPSVSGKNDMAKEEVFVPSGYGTPIEESVLIEGVQVKKRDSKRSLLREAERKSKEEGEVFMVVEEMPQFPGGDEALKKFLTENIVYPDSAKLLGTEGKVHVRFVVLPDGEISNASVIRGIGRGCDVEALRVINLMPKWIPGKQRGKPVKTQMTIPIEFKLR